MPSDIKVAAPRIFDRPLYLARQAGTTTGARDLLNARIAEELADRLSVITRDFKSVLLIAADADAFAPVVAQSGKVGNLIVRAPATGDALNLGQGEHHAIISLLDLHAVNDVPGYLAQISAALKADGLLMLNFFAGETLVELRDAWLAAEVEMTGGASPRVAPMIALRELGGLLQRANLALPVADMDRLTVRYADALSLMREIKTMGFSNPLIGRSPKFTSRAFLLSAARHYQTRFADPDGRIRTTLDLAWANAWKPDKSQPQPLKPGSAKVRLADALKVREEKF
jgi:hypothetical protein